MSIGTLLILEGIGVFVVATYYISKMVRVLRHGGVVKQQDKERIGRVLTFIGFAAVVVAPTLLGGRAALVEDHDLRKMYFLISLGAFAIFYTGTRFRYAAYQSPEKTDRFVKVVHDALASFWRDGTD
jgi:hypothetical protein